MDQEGTIKKTVFYEHSPSQVWEAITKKEAISTWFMQTDFTPEVGSFFTLLHKNGSVTGVITEVNEPTKLAYTWVINGAGEETLVEWILKEKNNGTEVTLIHSGFEKFSDDGRENAIALHTSGWEHQLTKALPNYLDKK